MVTSLVLATLLAAPCAHPVYTTHAPIICADAAPSTAFGKVVYRVNGRTRTLPASMVDVKRTMATVGKRRTTGGLSMVSGGGTEKAFAYKKIPIREVRRTQYAEPARKQVLTGADRRKLSLAVAQAERAAKLQRLNANAARSDMYTSGRVKDYFEAEYEQQKLKDAEALAARLKAAKQKYR